MHTQQTQHTHSETLRNRFYVIVDNGMLFEEMGRECFRDPYAHKL